MRNVAALLCSCASAVVLVGCNVEQSPTRILPTTPAFVSGTSEHASSTASIQAQINALYPPNQRGDIKQLFASVNSAVANGRTDEAVAGAIAFVKAVLQDLKNNDLIDPNGSQPPSTADALRELINAVADYAGLEAPLSESNPLAGDGAVGVVGPNGGTLVARSGFGGIQVPAGALVAEVIVVVERLPNPSERGQGPLPTALPQYPIFYEFSTTPRIEGFLTPVTVGLCHLEVGNPLGPTSQIVKNRLKLAHPNHANPATIDVLAPVAAPFVDCTATGGGVGGRVRTLSPFASVDPGTNFIAVSVGERHACALDDTGQAWCWGSNSAGQLGDGTLTNRTTPTPSAGGLRFSSVTAGGNHTCGFVTSGELYCWGSNVNGELGNGTTSNTSVPVPVSAAVQFRSVSLSLLHTCALTPTGAAYCWGSDRWGALGTTIPATVCSTDLCVLTPQAVVGGITFSDLSVGLENTCGVSSTGVGYCWGADQSGQLGDGQPTTGTCATNTLLVRCVIVPVPVQSSVQFASISTGSLFACGRAASGASYCWGDGRVGQRGDGTQTSTNVPVLVAGGNAFQVVRAEHENATLDHTCALTQGGAAYCWGSNETGQLGALATTTPCGTQTGTCALSPSAVVGGNFFSDIDTGLQFTCAVSIGRRVFCWGLNNVGQVGDGSTVNRGAPTQVALP